MRNNNRDIIISHLIERKERKKKGYKENEIQRTKELEEHEKKIARLRYIQTQKEKEGEYVEVRKRLWLLIKPGEDRETKIRQFLQKLEEAERSGKIMTRE